VDGPADLMGREVYGTSGDSLGFSMDGTHAQYCLIPIDSLATKPSNLSFAQAATIGVPFTTAALALHRANVQSIDVVLVLGASGAVGSAACQLGG
jgi:NADPH:quinone reductase